MSRLATEMKRWYFAMSNAPSVWNCGSPITSGGGV